MDVDEIIRAWTTEIVTVENQCAGLKPMKDLEAILLRHLEAFDEGPVQILRYGLEIIRRLTGQEGYAGEGHGALHSWIDRHNIRSHHCPENRIIQDNWSCFSG